MNRSLKITTLLLGYFMATFVVISQQKKELSNKDYGFQLYELEIPLIAPDDYESVQTFKLNTPLYPDKAYEVGFWIFGPQLKTLSYSFPIQVFPSNFMENVDSDIFELVTSKDIMPKLEVHPPPSFTSKGYFKFEIRPDTIYNHLTVALKPSTLRKPPIDIRKDVLIEALIVRLLPDAKEEKKITEKPAVTITEPKIKRAERTLIDSEKSYTVTEKELSIGLYDHRNIDKDRVTIYLNDNIVIENFELKKKKKFFKTVLKSGTNTITLHAENLGEVAPNTAAIVIKNKSQEFMAVLESDLGSSQFFTIVYEPE